MMKFKKGDRVEWTYSDPVYPEKVTIEWVIVEADHNRVLGGHYYNVLLDNPVKTWMGEWDTITAGDDNLTLVTAAPEKISIWKRFKCFFAMKKASTRH
ncbi:MAG: hypothetical protein ACXVPD_06585 [Bacteroidia bacterium]